jgi:dihydrofolate reductase
MTIFKSQIQHLHFLTIIVAVDLNNAIGAGGNLPWHLPQDLKFFKNNTWAMPVIMGRKTFESLGKPLTGRTNIVITRNPDWKASDVLVAGEMGEAIALAGNLKTREIFIIGGGSIYEAALPLASRLYITRVFTRVENADTWFPQWQEKEWEMKWEQAFGRDEKHPFDYSFQCWERVGIQDF